MEAFNQYRSGVRVRMDASGRFNRDKRLQGIESVEHMYVLDPLDVGARLVELRQLRHGWLDGKGLAPPHSGLDWLAATFERYYPDGLPLPHLYPTPEGGVRAEWSIAPSEASLEINLENKLGIWHVLNLSDDSESSGALALDDARAWEWLTAEVRRLAGVTA